MVLLGILVRSVQWRMLVRIGDFVGLLVRVQVRSGGVVLLFTC